MRNTFLFVLRSSELKAIQRQVSKFFFPLFCAPKCENSIFVSIFKNAFGWYIEKAQSGQGAHFMQKSKFSLFFASILTVFFLFSCQTALEKISLRRMKFLPYFSTIGVWAKMQTPAASLCVDSGTILPVCWCLHANVAHWVWAVIRAILRWKFMGNTSLTTLRKEIAELEQL